MLELIRHWLVGITCAAMLVALGESLIPAGSIRRIARLTGGLVLLAAILNPLLKLDTTALTRALTEYKLELSAYSADLEEENEILMKVRRIYSGQGGRPGHRLPSYGGGGRGGRVAYSTVGYRHGQPDGRAAGGAGADH